MYFKKVFFLEYNTLVLSPSLLVITLLNMMLSACWERLDIMLLLTALWNLKDTGTMGRCKWIFLEHWHERVMEADD